MQAVLRFISLLMVIVLPLVVVGEDKKIPDYQAVLDFWFKELTPRQWYIKDPKLDRMIEERFGELHAQAAKGELFSWRATPDGRVAEIIVLDQFSRNIFRNTAKAFAFDGIALVLAQEAVMSGAIDKVGASYQSLLLMPYMHSESKLMHEQAMVLRKHYQLDLYYEQKHKNIIDRFGRYPHRNQLLGRESTAEEIQFLKEPGSSF